MAKTSDVKTLVQQLARAHEGVVEGVACAGTQLESRTYSVGKRAFLHVGNAEPTVIRFKLDASAAAAKKHGVDVGAGGWCKLVLAAGDGVPPALASWIAESHVLMSGGGTAKPKPKPKAARKSKRR